MGASLHLETWLHRRLAAACHISTPGGGRREEGMRLSCPWATTYERRREPVGTRPLARSGPASPNHEGCEDDADRRSTYPATWIGPGHTPAHTCIAAAEDRAATSGGRV